jgi:hypothetical protein
MTVKAWGCMELPRQTNEEPEEVEGARAKDPSWRKPVAKGLGGQGKAEAL